MKRKKTEKAVAVRYAEGESTAPRVVAAGQGLVAAKIIEAAEEAGIHIHEDPNLVELLSKVDIGEEIPVELYQTVAEVLAFVYRVNEKFKEKIESEKKYR